MAPKKQQKQEQAAAAAAESTSTSEQNNNNTVSKQEQEDEEEPKPSPILDKPTLVVLDDGRQIFGHLIAFDANGSVLLSSIIERKKFNDTIVTQRSGVSVSIPFGHITSFLQRDEDPEEVKAIYEKNEKAVEELKKKLEAPSAPVEAEKKE